MHNLYVVIGHRIYLIFLGKDIIAWTYLRIDTGKVWSLPHERVGAMQQHNTAFDEQGIFQNSTKMERIGKLQLQIFVSKSEQITIWELCKNKEPFISDQCFDSLKDTLGRAT